MNGERRRLRLDDGEADKTGAWGPDEGESFLGCTSSESRDVDQGRACARITRSSSFETRRQRDVGEDGV